MVRKAKKEWFLNPSGKSTVCILHEYIQHSLKQQPIYKYSEVDSSATPYSCSVAINGIEYGRGYGGSKKNAKNEAAAKALEVLIPELKERLGKDKEGPVESDLSVRDFWVNSQIFLAAVSCSKRARSSACCASSCEVHHALRVKYFLEI